MITPILADLAAGRKLSEDGARGLIGAFLEGSIDEVEQAAILTALRVRGESVDELVGATRALLDRIPATKRRRGVLDTCGTGADASGTFNISTAAAIVASACGVPVAKHGNRAVSSATGSADVLAELGVPLDAPPESAEKALDAIGLGFFFAPAWHRAIAGVMPVRKKLRFRTIFNLIGPLANPVGAEYRLLGVGDAAWQRPLAEALLRLEVRRALIVHGRDGLDEITLAGETDVLELRDGVLQHSVWSPVSLGLAEGDPSRWRVESPAASAKLIRTVLEGGARDPGGPRDLVVANAAAALYIAGKGSTPADCVQLADQAIDSGAAREQLTQLTRIQQEAASSPGSP